MNIFTKTAVAAAIAASLAAPLMISPANAGGCGPDWYCDDHYAPPSIEQVLVHEARRGLKHLDRYLEHRYGDDTPHRPMRRGKRR